MEGRNFQTYISEDKHFFLLLPKIPLKGQKKEGGDKKKKTYSSHTQKTGSQKSFGLFLTAILGAREKLSTILKILKETDF